MLGLWVYKDAKSRGLNAKLWVIAVIFIPNFIGLILYFIVGRKQIMIECSNCNSRINYDSKYCNKCGHVIDISDKETVEFKSNKATIRALIITFVIFVISIILIFGIAFFGNIDSYDFNVNIGGAEWNIGNEWKVSFYKSNETFKKSLTIKDSNTQKLSIKSELEKGELFLRIVQEDKEDIIDLTNVNGQMEYDLNKFNSGKLKCYLYGNNAKKVKFKATIE